MMRLVLYDVKALVIIFTFFYVFGDFYGRKVVYLTGLLEFIVSEVRKESW